ncbi:MAG TPA: hypothetical protein VNE39_09850 [Planctomycetota bacterium]|nr:hypothetical protein [Planctomycetota bacterium]
MKKAHFFALIAGLAVTFGGPALGLFLAVRRMTAVVALAQAHTDGSPPDLATAVVRALAPTQAGLLVGALGLAIALGAIALHFAARRRRRRTPPAASIAASQPHVDFWTGS